MIARLLVVLVFFGIVAPVATVSAAEPVDTSSVSASNNLAAEATASTSSPVSASTAATGGGCGKWKQLGRTGIKVRACISQNTDRHIQPVVYFRQTATSKRVYDPMAKIAVMHYYASDSYERTNAGDADIDWGLWQRPRVRNFWRKGWWVAPAVGDQYATRVTVCARRSPHGALKCTSARSRVQVAGD